ncbi:transporter [Actinoplanes capillaceus]|uniref:Transporter n=1 Tax=Actinoplanes campanulatus TaxID=113559 RepID=A0ABQ3WJY0_9ACTN|nr:ABC transporter permease [Actinoplanes capillaceus]GID46550.1 transporter [Actinoplanes capillaceus]
MTMLSFALGSVRRRRGTFLATFVNVFVGAVVLMAFAALLDTAGGAAVAPADASSLRTIAAAVGGWGLVIVGFGVASTTNLAMRQRQPELALLKAVGATPAQVGRLVTGEGVVVALIAVAVGVIPAWLLGRTVLGGLDRTGQLTADVAYRFGPLALLAGIATTLVATVGATAITGRSAGRVSAREALGQAAGDGRKLGKSRGTAGAALLVAGAGCAVAVATGLKGEGFTTLSIAGQACIASALGLALLSPIMLRALVAPIGSGRAPLHLAVSAVRERSRQAATVTMPVIVLTALSVGTFYVQDIQNDANAAEGIAVSLDDEGVRTLNLIIISMISFFAAVVLVNNCVAGLLARREEFGLARRIGATPGQILRSVAWETGISATAGLALGTVAAAIGIAGFAYGRTGSATPDLDRTPYLGVVALVIVLTCLASLPAARRALTVPMIDAAGPARG